MRFNFRSKDPISDFFLNEMSAADGSALGREYAAKAISTLKRDNKNLDAGNLQRYLIAWNERGGSPFTRDEMIALSRIAPAARAPKSAPKPEPEAFAVRLLEEA